MGSMIHAMGMPRSGFVKRASLVLAMVDDFTNEAPGYGSVYARMEGLPPPVHKADGYFVFMDVPEGTYEVQIRGNIYQERTVTVTLEKEQPCPVLTVRLMPGILYPLPQKAISITGRAEPGSQVRAIWKPEGNTLKLLYDYTEGAFIRIFSTELRNLEGYMFCIQDQEYFTILQTVDEEERIYRMDRELKQKYKKSAARLSFVTQVQADVSGIYYTAVCGPGERGLECRIEISSEEKPETIQVKAGDRIRLT